MPPVKKKKKTKAKHFDEQEDTESSESGKLSETLEVAQHLSRTRLDKENACTPQKRKSKSLVQQKNSDPYDADSEPEAGVLSSMIVDQNIPLERQLLETRLASLRGDHSTPNLQPNRTVYSSCYGFDNLDSPLPFSPVGEPMMPSQFVPVSPGSVSVTSSVTSISPAKRKAVVFDVPIEKPSKKMKKKKATKVLDIEDEDWVTEMKSQFEEIEMVDLVVD
ncbi:uncharacterized protein LOC144637301 isoform X2 [Oculina patagonica]